MGWVGSGPEPRFPCRLLVQHGVGVVVLTEATIFAHNAHTLSAYSLLVPLWLCWVRFQTTDTLSRTSASKKRASSYPLSHYLCSANRVHACWQPLLNDEPLRDPEFASVFSQTVISSLENCCAVAASSHTSRADYCGPNRTRCSHCAAAADFDVRSWQQGGGRAVPHGSRSSSSRSR